MQFHPAGIIVLCIEDMLISLLIALRHISSNSGDNGWARWWMNSTTQPVRVKTDSSKWARLKGLDVTVVRPGTSPSAAQKLRQANTSDEGIERQTTRDSADTKSSSKKSLLKTVKGIRVEFKDLSQRNIFLGMSKRIQEKL